LRFIAAPAAPLTDSRFFAGAESHLSIQEERSRAAFEAGAAQAWPGFPDCRENQKSVPIADIDQAKSASDRS